MVIRDKCIVLFVGLFLLLAGSLPLLAQTNPKSCRRDWASYIPVEQHPQTVRRIQHKWRHEYHAQLDHTQHHAIEGHQRYASVARTLQRAVTSFNSRRMQRRVITGTLRLRLLGSRARRSIRLAMVRASRRSRH